MPKIIRFHETGNADVLKIEDLPHTEPGEGEVRLKVEAFSLNRADIMFRQRCSTSLEISSICPRLKSPTNAMPAVWALRLRARR